MNDLDFKTIGLNIRKRRKFLGITQEFIAEQLDVNPSHISNIECGRANPSLTALVKIANILHCSVDCFICGEYTFQSENTKTESPDHKMIEKLHSCDTDTQNKIIKIIDILTS